MENSRSSVSALTINERDSKISIELLHTSVPCYLVSKPLIAPTHRSPAQSPAVVFQPSLKALFIIISLAKSLLDCLNWSLLAALQHESP